MVAESCSSFREAVEFVKSKPRDSSLDENRRLENQASVSKNMALSELMKALFVYQHSI